MITEYNVNIITGKTVAKLGMGWRKRESKAQKFQDSFPKAQSTEILSTFEETRNGMYCL